jgi:large subunit ribosomal protein L32
MPVPKRKRSRCRRDKRFANKGMAVHAITPCSSCNASLMPHTACMSCGFYKGKKVVRTKAERTMGRTTLRQAQKAVRTPAAKTARGEE